MNATTSQITFHINGKPWTVSKEEQLSMRLVDFLREVSHLTGTKVVCREGSCGACVVTIAKYDPVTKSNASFAVNSCLIPVYSCNGCEVTTIEGLGNKKKGYHVIEQRMSMYYATQCGYCSPGMVMTMYSLLQNKSLPSMKDVEENFDGNLCRCTGYRPILDAMKTFCSKNELNDIEDLVEDWEKMEFCPKLPLKLTESIWQPKNLKELFEILKELGNGKIKLVVGNTGSGVFPEEDSYDFYVDMKGITELYSYSSRDTLTIGANVSFNHLINILSSQKSQGFSYCATIADRIKQIANTPVRNVACWAGNLMLKRSYPQFASDLFPLLEAVGAKLTLLSFNNVQTVVSPAELLNAPMKSRIIKNMILPRLSANHFFLSESVRKRHQNAPSYANAALLIQLNPSNNYQVLAKPSLVFGGVDHLIHAKKTEEYLQGKNLSNETTLSMAFQCLQKEESIETPGSTSTPYQMQLKLTLFYKMILQIVEPIVSARYKSGAGKIVRSLSTSKQDFPTDEKQYPITQPLPKLESKAQCSGEIKYTTDLTTPSDTLYGAFVLSTVAKATIKTVNTVEAMKMPGVVTYVTAKDIPGENNIIPLPDFDYLDPEELFCSGEVKYVGQPLALIVADTAQHAQEAVKKVQVSYTNIKTPVLTIEDAIRSGPVTQGKDFAFIQGDAEESLQKAQNKLQGEVAINSRQFNFYLETQVCLCVPNDTGVDIYASTQCPSIMQKSLSRILKLERSKIRIPTQIVGGAFGGKDTRSFYTSGASSVAACLLYKPVCVHLDLRTNMQMLGKRNAALAKYQVGFQSNGTLEAVKVEYYVDGGSTRNESETFMQLIVSKNVYQCPNWSLIPYTVITNTPNNNYCRGPGNPEGVLVIEYIIDHVAQYLNKDPVEIRQLNLTKTFLQPQVEGVYCSLYDFQNLFNQLLTNSQYSQRQQQIQQFNQNNRWRKKGLSVSPMKYDIDYENLSYRYSASVAILSEDGSVVITHAGIEIGQGINVKVIQVCAHELGIPIELIDLRPTSSALNPDGSASDGSVTSELNCLAVMKCCQILNERLDPIRKKMNNPPWKQLIDQAYKDGLILFAHNMVGPQSYPKNYSVYGAATAEVEVDVLTGDVQVNRVDLLYDAGSSINPYVDVGQIEGAFVMGLGLYLTELTKFDTAGKNLTATTWEYFPPMFKDIPVDFRLQILKNAPNPNGVLGSKSVGVPPVGLSACVFLAVKHAVAASRSEDGDNTWFAMSVPATPENIFLSCNLNSDSFTFKDKNFTINN